MEYSKKVKWWLFIGLVMLIVQVVVGGITRLTESGLSITKWEVVGGTLPPLTEKAWLEAFALYQQTPQYQEVNEGMSLSNFKFIYFWEFIHRFWARTMGFVFLFPLIWFLIKKEIDLSLLRRLSLMVGLALLAATFGWIMVASGLIERPWVNAYKLSLHLCIALAVYVALLWTFLYSLRLKMDWNGVEIRPYKKHFWVFLAILSCQIFLGGVLSGMKAAVVFPTWPSMNGSYFPAVLFNPAEWNMNNFNDYDKNLFMPTLIHFLHRNTAYLVFIVGILFSMRFRKYGDRLIGSSKKRVKILSSSIIILLIIQVILGIITLVNSQGSIPILWGVLHQAFALFVLTASICTIFILKLNNYEK